jgi:drug/metabolite transporter (DMT)-like permease
MGSLRTFHIFFLLVVIAAADLFGVWAIWDYSKSQDGTILALGVMALVGGLGLIAYTIWFIRKLNRAHIE